MIKEGKGWDTDVIRKGHFCVKIIIHFSGGVLDQQGYGDFIGSAWTHLKSVKVKFRFVGCSIRMQHTVADRIYTHFLYVFLRKQQQTALQGLCCSFKSLSSTQQTDGHIETIKTGDVTFCDSPCWSSRCHLDKVSDVSLSCKCAAALVVVMVISWSTKVVHARGRKTRLRMSLASIEEKRTRSLLIKKENYKNSICRSKTLEFSKEFLFPEMSVRIFAQLPLVRRFILFNWIHLLNLNGAN